MDFEAFSKNLYTILTQQEFGLAMTASDNVAESSHWIVQKREMATLVSINVIDNTKALWENILSISKMTEAHSAGLNVGSVANVYILAGGDIPSFSGASDFFGQPIYSIFWHVDINSGEVTAPNGQPKKFINLREVIAKSCASSNESAPSSFLEINRQQQSLMPAARYKHAYITYFIIGINAIILAAMYLQGFPQDILVPMRFGAIYPPLILYGGEWYRLFTAMFIHFGLAHFAANSMGLLIFGTRIERFFGRFWFVVIYVATGLVGSVASLFLSRAYSAGASGAIYGLVGFIFVYTRLSKRSIEYINWYVMFIYIGFGIAMGFTQTGIDNFAHLGGLFAGAVFGAAYYKLYYKTGGKHALR